MCKVGEKMYFGYFSNRILERGKAYFKKNRVFSLRETAKNKYSAIVLGSEPYHVTLKLNNKGNIVEAHCDCPYAKDGNRCKHEAALYYALEDRLIKDHGLFFDVKKVYDYCQRVAYNEYSIHYQFNKELDKYFYQLDKTEIDDGILNNFQKMMDDFVSLYYPVSFRNKMIKKILDKYRTIMKTDENNMKWLQRSLNNKRYQSCLDPLIDILQAFDAKLQLDILKTVLMERNNDFLLSLYIRLLAMHGEDVAQNLKDLPNCQNLGLFHFEMIRYYLNHGDVDTAHQQYQDFLAHPQAKTSYYLNKIESKLFTDKKEHFYTYVCQHCHIHDYHDVLYCYWDLKDVYDQDDHYPIMFLKWLKDRVDYEYYCMMLNETNNIEMLMLELLSQSNMNFFNDYKKRIYEFDQADYYLVFVNCLLEHMQFVKTAKDYQIAQKWFDELFEKIADPLTKIEIAHLFIEKYPKRKKIRDIVESYLDDRGTR